MLQKDRALNENIYYYKERTILHQDQNRYCLMGMWLSISIYISWPNVVREGVSKAHFSINTTLGCRGRHYSFSRIAPFNLNLNIIMLCFKQGSIKYYFLSLWHDLTISRSSNHYAKGPAWVYIYIYIYNFILYYSYLPKPSARAGYDTRSIF